MLKCRASCAMVSAENIEKKKVRGRIRNFFLDSDYKTPYLSHPREVA